MTTIRVTEDHIRRAKPEDGMACPVALAINDALPGARAHVVPWAATVFGREIPLPDDVPYLIDCYDMDRKMEPFEFELPVEAPDA